MWDGVGYSAIHYYIRCCSPRATLADDSDAFASGFTLLEGEGGNEGAPQPRQRQPLTRRIVQK